ncbi:MAG TPA: hypothetical protein VK968_15165 [Roseimicrobium sp.]|nr:hypothetical protein [Roseimicrobium sp.]
MNAINGGIYLIQSDETLVELTEQPYDSEDLLQQLLAKYPSLLAGNQMDSTKPRRWLLVCREAAVPSEDGGPDRWSVDHLFLDQDAIPTLVEVKRSSDSRIRREVVGQMLDYAANAVVYWPVEEIRAKFETRCEKDGKDPNSELGFFLAGDGDAERFWGQVKANLQAGCIRMVFVADEIPNELRRIVEFLNQQMKSAEVLAVEIKQFVGSGLKTLVPRVMGQTAEAERAKSSGGSGSRQWNEVTFFQELESVEGLRSATAAREILKWAKTKSTRILYGRGGRTGSFVPSFNHRGQEHQLFAVYTYGTVEIYFQWYQYKPPFENEAKRLELLRRLNEIPGVSLQPDVITRRPGISLSLLKDDATMKLFIAVFEWFMCEIKDN